LRNNYIEPIDTVTLEQHFSGKEITYTKHPTVNQEERKKINELVERVNFLLEQEKIKHGK
jgi:hypothetical protein